MMLDERQIIELRYLKQVGSFPISDSIHNSIITITGMHASTNVEPCACTHRELYAMALCAMALCVVFDIFFIHTSR